MTKEPSPHSFIKAREFARFVDPSFSKNRESVLVIQHAGIEVGDMFASGANLGPLHPLRLALY